MATGTAAAEAKLQAEHKDDPKATPDTTASTAAKPGNEPSTLSAFLWAIRQHESGQTYQASSDPSDPAAGATGAYQFIQSTWTAEATDAGYAQYAGKPARTAPDTVQDAVAAYMATRYWDEYHTWSDAAQSWYTPSHVGSNAIPAPTAGNTETETAYGAAIVGLMGQAPSGTTKGSASTPSLNAQNAVATAQKNLDAAEKGGTLAAIATAQSALATAKSDYTTAVQTAATKAQTSTSTGATAAANIDAVLKSAGLTSLIGWANELAKTLTAKGLSPSGIGTEIVTKMQTTPQSAPIFNEKFPGFSQRVKNGYPAMSITQYLTYQEQAKQAASAAGLTLTSAEIGHLFAENVGSTELASGKGTNLARAVGSTAALKTEFTKVLPGFTQRVANGYPPLSVTQYVTYVDKAKAAGQEVGLPLDDKEIGSLIAGNVPITELSTGRGVNLANVLKTTAALKETFTRAFPGYLQRIENGYPAISLTQYRTYETKAKAMALAAGLPANFMGGKEVGELVANNVSSAELSTRLTNAYAAAMNVPEATKSLLHQYYGINTGHLAAYWLTPDKATNVFKQTITHVKQEITSAQIGATAKASGFTLGRPEKYATVQKKVTTGTAGNMKVTPLYLAQVGVSQATARETFKSLATLLPLTKSLPETGGEKTALTQNDLVNYGFYGTNAAELANVEQARTAPFRGGGGYIQTSKGVIGAGYGSAQGVEAE